MSPARPYPTNILAVPYEIRLKIYFQLLKTFGPEAIRIVNANDHKDTWPQGEDRAVVLGQPYHYKLDIDPSFLLTCRQINSKASHLLYGNNAFRFSHDCNVEQYLEAIGNHNVCLIKRVQVAGCSICSGSGGCWATERLAIALGSIPNLEELSIYFTVDTGVVDWIDDVDADKILVLARTPLRATKTSKLA